MDDSIVLLASLYWPSKEVSIVGYLSSIIGIIFCWIPNTASEALWLGSIKFAVILISLSPFKWFIATSPRFIEKFAISFKKTFLPLGVTIFMLSRFLISDLLDSSYLIQSFISSFPLCILWASSPKNADLTWFMTIWKSRPRAYAFSFNWMSISLKPCGSLWAISTKIGLDFKFSIKSSLAFFRSDLLLLKREIATGLPPKLAPSLMMNFSAPGIVPVFSLIKEASIDDLISCVLSSLSSIYISNDATLDPSMFPTPATISKLSA